MIELSADSLLKLHGGEYIAGSIFIFRNWQFDDDSFKDKLILFLKSIPEKEIVYIFVLNSYKEKYEIYQFYKDRVFHITRERATFLKSDSVIFIPELKPYGFKKFKNLITSADMIGTLSLDLMNEIKERIRDSDSIDEATKNEVCS